LRKRKRKKGKPLPLVDWAGLDPRQRPLSLARLHLPLYLSPSPAHLPARASPHPCPPLSRCSPTPPISHSLPHPRTASTRSPLAIILPPPPRHYSRTSERWHRSSPARCYRVPARHQLSYHRNCAAIIAASLHLAYAR
jgi:hypothetical protein